MSRPNFDAQRAANLKRIYEEKVKAAAAKKKADEQAAKDAAKAATKEANIVSDAKAD